MNTGYKIGYLALKGFLARKAAEHPIQREEIAALQEILDEFYAPFRQVAEAAGSSDSMPRPLTSTPIPTQPQPSMLIPVPSTGYQTNPSKLRPVVHSLGPIACGGPAYYLVTKVSRYTKANINNMRMIHSMAPPVPGIDRQECGSCHQHINLFSADDLDFRPHIMTDAEEQQARRDAMPKFPGYEVTPELEELNQTSTRWQAKHDQPDKLAELIGIATSMHSLDDLTLPEDADAGLPPESEIPKLPEVPKEDFDFTFDSEPGLEDGPERQSS